MTLRSSRSAAELIPALREARERTLALVADLDEQQLMGLSLPLVNPLRWEIGHVAWFYEYFVLRYFLGAEPILSDGDALYNSATVPHDPRWALPLLDRDSTLGYMQRVLDTICEREHELEEPRDRDGYRGPYFMELALLHEGMHDEAFTYTRQTLGYPAPRFPGREAALPGHRIEELSPALGDAHVPGATLYLGSRPTEPFVFDNEQWAHPVEVKPFALARTAVSNREYLNFVEDGGYGRRDLWTAEGWWWRNSVGAEHPVYWQQGPNGEWLRRNFDHWVSLEAALPVLHVNWYEADAFCRWAGRRLPTEVEWELAATGTPGGDAGSKRVYPWGDEAPTPDRANLDWAVMGTLPVSALPAGDSAFGCRQMIGNVWEWTATDFGPFPGFAPGPYKEYSEPWFFGHKVLRGGCWATRSRLIRSAYRNFYPPDRRDVWAGFRTCALDG
ncbi:MAG: ergothioneine biosynthesis protein EgtB [Chloroflexi bacterium]|nr:ergothioneine biosynthesis protein EgtB [Chloroflexota bacterium]